jgi:hypothetical protein
MSDMQTKMFQKTTRKVAEKLVESIRKGEYTDNAEFYMEGITSINDPIDQESISLLGSMVCTYVNVILDDKNLSIWIKSNFNFVAFIKEAVGTRITIGCGFLKKEETKILKKMAKNSEGRIGVNQACNFCYDISSKIQKCGGCRCVAYCCKEHQLADWKEHKQECKLLQNAKQM